MEYEADALRLHAFNTKRDHYYLAYTTYARVKVFQKVVI